MWQVYKPWDTSHLSKALFGLQPIPPATKADETNHIHDFTVALQTDSNNWTSM